MTVERGTVESVRLVTLQGQPTGAGAAVGSTLGAIAGAAAGSDSYNGSWWGALAGALFGDALRRMVIFDIVFARPPRPCRSREMVDPVHALQQPVP